MVIQKDRNHKVTPFPTKLVGVATVLTLAVLAWLSWFVYDAYKFVQDTNSRIVGLEQARGDIVHLDEVLTMSASMAAATGEAEWIDRYRRFEPKLDAAIKQAVDVAQRSDVADAIRETDAANVELVKMENRAFALIHARRLDEARAILSGTSYSDQKQLYAGGMEKLLRSLRAEREAAVESQRTATLGSMLAMGFVAVVIIVAWLLILGRVREWRAAMSKNVSDLVRAEEALRTSHDELEQRVADRTRELEDDISERKRTERELAEKEAHLRIALDSMPGGMMLGDRDLNYVLYNAQYSELYEFPDGLVRAGTSFRDELRYQADRSDFGPGDKDALVEQVVATYQKGEAVSYEREIAGSGRMLQVDLAPTPEGGYVTIVADITARKKAEAELARKEAQLRVAMDNMPGGMFMVDENLAFQVYNEQYKDMYELPDEALQEGVSLAVPVRIRAERGDYGPGDPEELVEQRMQGYIERMTLRDEERLPNGRVIELLRTPVEGGGVVGIATDITERKRAEEDIAAKEAQLRIVLDNMPGGIRCFDKDNRLLFFNTQYSELWDLPDGLLKIGDSLRVENLYLAERGDYGDGDLEELVDSVMYALPFETEPQQYERTTINGRNLDCRTRPTELGGYVSIHTDITERKQAEEALRESEEQVRLLLDSTAEAIYGIDINGECTFCNPACVAMLGYDGAEDLLGRHIHDLIHHTRPDGNPYPAEECLIYQAFREGEGTHVDNEVLWRKDGTSFAAEYWSHPINRDDRVIGAVVTFLDITERKRAEEALREKTEFLALNQIITRAANEAASVEDALQIAVDRVCAHTGWPIGHVYLFDEAAGDLASARIWHQDDPKQFRTFRGVSEATRFASGIGLPGRVLASGEPAWIVDVTKDRNFPRAKLA